jgi:cytochrome c-type biogenesis protein CcmH/NrfG
MDPHDPQGLYNLAGAYAMNRDYDEAMQVIHKLKEIKPDYPGLKQLEKQIQKVRN